MKTNTDVYPEDLREFNRLIKSECNENEINLFCSFTYITPNYSIILTLNELKKFIENKNYKIFIIVWDMNTFANPYFKRMRSSRKISNPVAYIDSKVKELRGLILSMGFNSNQVIIHKSSDVWKRLISYKEEDLFYQFYDVLSQIELGEEINDKRASHLFQIPMDLFFCNYFHKLYPEDTNHAIDLAFLGPDKEILYTLTRKLMVQGGLINFKKPLFILLKSFPYLIYNYVMPEWNMDKQQMKELLINCNLSEEDIISLLEYIDVEVSEVKKLNHKKMLSVLTEQLYAYLQKYKQNFEDYNGNFEAEIINVSKKEEMKKIGKFLKSNISLDILLLANGDMSVTQISKLLGKSVATISMYVKRLKKSGFIKTSSEGKLNRTIKGIKLSFEFGSS